MAGKKWNRRLSGVLGLAIALSVPAAAARAEDAPAPPSTPPAGLNQRGRAGIAVERLVGALAKLDLSRDQQEKTKALFDDTRDKLRELKESASENPDRQVMTEKSRAIFGNTRDKLAEILTPDQQLKLRDLMQQQPPAAEPAERPKPPEVATKAKKLDPAGEPKDMMMQDDRAKKPAVAKPTAGPVKSSPAVEVGQAAPDFSLKTLDGKPVSLASLKGRLVVLVFGSYTTPTFRDHLPALEKLAKENGSKASFYILYTSEAHAVGDWEVDRNKDEKILVEQPKTETERQSLAKQAASTLNITVPILIDEMDNAVAQAYGLAPNGAVVIGRDGAVVARQHWFEPMSLRQQLDGAVAARAAK